MRGAFYLYDISDYQQHTIPGGSVPFGENDYVYNIDHVFVYGLELEATRDFAESISGYLSYTWQAYDAEHSGFDKDFTYHLFQRLPKNKVTLGLNVKPWKGGSFNLSVRYVDTRKNQAGEAMDPFVLMNIGYRHSFELKGMKFSLKGYVANLLNRDYQECYGYPMPGINGGVILRAGF